jgi:hypothetical protein
VQVFFGMLGTHSRRNDERRHRCPPDDPFGDAADEHPGDAAAPMAAQQNQVGAHGRGGLTFDDDPVRRDVRGFRTRDQTFDDLPGLGLICSNDRRRIAKRRMNRRRVDVFDVDGADKRQPRLTSAEFEREVGGSLRRLRAVNGHEDMLKKTHVLLPLRDQRGLTGNRGFDFD